MIFYNTINKQNSLREAITAAYRMDENACIHQLLPAATLPPDMLHQIVTTAEQLVIGTQERRKKQGGLDAFLHEYDLSSEEGIALMCLAEALLRIPDTHTIDRLISDKISTADWEQHLNSNHSLFVNAATWSLLLSGKMLAPTLNSEKTFSAALKRVVSRLSSAVIRPIVLQGMKIIDRKSVV